MELDNDWSTKNSFLRESLTFDEGRYVHHPEMAEEESVNVGIDLYLMIVLAQHAKMQTSSKGMKCPQV